MADEAVLEILKALRADVADLRNHVSANTIAVRLLTDQVEVLRQDVRMVRAALNDMERTRITGGEVEAIHTDLNRLQQDYAGLAARVEAVERR